MFKPGNTFEDNNKKQELMELKIFLKYAKSFEIEKLKFHEDLKISHHLRQNKIKKNHSQTLMNETN